MHVYMYSHIISVYRFKSNQCVSVQGGSKLTGNILGTEKQNVYECRPENASFYSLLVILCCYKKTTTKNKHIIAFEIGKTHK